MSYLIIASLSYLIQSIVFLFDKYILSQKIPRPLAYAFYTGLIEIFVVVLIPFGFFIPGLNVFALSFFSGAVYIFALLFLYKALKESETSRVVPLIGSLVPIMIFLLDFLFGTGALNRIEIWAFFLLILGGILISFKFRGTHFSKSGLVFSLVSAVLFASSFYLIGLSFKSAGFITSFVIARTGGFLTAISFLAVPRARAVIFAPSSKIKKDSAFALGLNKALAGAAFILLNYAIFLKDAALVQSMQGLQYVFLIFLAVILSYRRPDIFRETIDLLDIFKKLVAVFLIGAGLFLLSFSGPPATPASWLAWRAGPPAQADSPGAVAEGTQKFGVTFSKPFAEKLGYDWKAVYLAILDELGARAFRLPAYWDEIEKEKGVYDFSDLDWQINEAGKRGAKIILAIGQRLPRWPECHIPEWLVGASAQERQKRLMSFLEETVLRYKDNPSVWAWQVENEPFLIGFGECPEFDAGFLDEEIALVKNLDKSRPVIVSDSGELSLWLRAYKRSDIFGTTMYKVVWDERLPGEGYFKYPLPPEFFWLKANLVRFFYGDKPIVVVELQAEPWGPKMIYETDYEEHKKSMDFEQFKENIEYARQVGFEEAYLWGAEWWYLVKEKYGDDRFWKEAGNVLK